MPRQALVALCPEQEQHFLALLQAQVEDQQVIQSLVQLACIPAVASVDAAATSPPVKLLKMDSQDNAEAFVERFQHVAEACAWPTSMCNLPIAAPVREAQLKSSQSPTCWSIQT